MEYLGAVIVALVGAVFILIRNLYAKFIMSFLYQIPALKKHEKSILRWISIIAVLGGVAFVVIGVILAVNVAISR